MGVIKMKNNSLSETSALTTRIPLLDKLKDSYESKLSGTNFSKPYTIHGLIKDDNQLVIRGRALSKRSLSALTPSKIFPFIGFVKEFHDSSFKSLLGLDYDNCGVFLVDNDTVIIADKSTTKLLKDMLVLKEDYGELKSGTLLLSKNYEEISHMVSFDELLDVYCNNSNHHQVPKGLMEEVDLDEYTNSGISFLDRK